MTKPFKISDAAHFLYKLDVNFHASGILRDKSGVALYDFYKTDFLTDSQKGALTLACPDVTFRGAYAEYAPELRGIYICFPKAAIKRKLKEAM